MTDQLVPPAELKHRRGSVDADGDTAPAALQIVNGSLLRHGEAHQVLAGSLHSFRVHPEQWADRVHRIAAMGCNTIDTYVAWNRHQPHEHALPDFDGWNDIARFADLVADAGLDLILRPGPYICAEWDNGGFPAWLTARQGIRLRCTDPQYLEAVSAWFDALVPELLPLQAANGGPLVAIQVENEYGSYADDAVHMAWLRDALRTRGISELLFTADGATQDMQAAGSLDDTFAAATFGSNPTAARDLMQRRSPDKPFFAAEFWGGWFDHWGEPHHVRSGEDAAANIGEIVQDRGSVSLYMAHGGTNFGLRAGANHDGLRIQPTVTSYDSDAPIAEDGSITEKFVNIRTVLRPDLANEPLPAPPRLVPPQQIAVYGRRRLLDALSAIGQASWSPHPMTFEQLALDAGLTLHSCTTDLSGGHGPLRLIGLRDRATVFVNGKIVGTIEDDSGEVTITQQGRIRLDIVVENQGRINYGPRLGEGKGIHGGVLLGRRYLTGWTSRPLPLDQWTSLDLRALSDGAADAHGVTVGPGIYTAEIGAHEHEDAHLAFPGFGKGFAWIDDFLLGRYWERGPQRTLYVPAPLLRHRSVVTILELEHAGTAVEFAAQPVLGPSEQYVEHL